MGTRTWGTLAAIALVLGGCGDSDDTSAATTSTTEPVTTSTTTEPRTSAEQAASIVAGYRGEIQEAWSFHQDCSTFDCLRLDNTLSRMIAVIEDAHALGDELSDAMPFEDDIADLATATYGPALKLPLDWNSKVAGCVEENRDSALDSCGDVITEAEQSIDEFVALLDRWEPYL